MKSHYNEILGLYALGILVYITLLTRLNYIDLDARIFEEVRDMLTKKGTG